MTRGLFIGRFQPFHNGHLEVIREMASMVDDIIIGIGSAQVSHTPEDPFTAGERHLMISGAMQDAGIDNYFIIPLVDINRYSTWVAHVRSLVPPFDMVFTNNPLTARLFREAGIEVRKPGLYDREKYSGSVIRRLMLEGGDWESLVPDATRRVIREIGGIARLRELAGMVEP